jgi:small subunit ribosomal protein S4
MADNSARAVPPWLTVSRDELTASVSVLPTRDIIPTLADEQQVIEFYAKQ